MTARLRAGSRRAVDLGAANAERLVVAGLVVVFIAISVWWVQTDGRVPGGDNAKHTLHAFTFMDEFQVGHWLSVIMVWTEYPPLVHVVGGIGAWIAGASNDAVVIAENVVFVPLLALGCYESGKLLFGRLAGVLAVLFAFAAPMTMSLFHVFMLDAPAAAVAAVSVWLLLASRRFESLPWTLAASVAVAAGMYIKATFIFFVVGLALVLLVRGGWRHWRHAIAGIAVFLIAVEAWYFAHLEDLRGQATGALQPQQVLWHGGVPYPDRWSLANYGWYWWNLVNNQLYLPLTLFFLVGLAVLGVRYFRDRRPDDCFPELAGGALIAYFGISVLSLDDPRYTFPGLVYLAVVGTGWIALLRPSWRVVAAGTLASILIVNTALLNYVRPQDLVLRLPGATGSPIGERSLRVLSSHGFIEGRPDRGTLASDFVELLRRARADGAKRVVFQPESLNSGGYNLNALSIFARTAGLEVPGYDWRALAPQDIYVFRVALEQVDRPACLESWDKTGIYMVKGQPSATKAVYCPPADA